MIDERKCYWIVGETFAQYIANKMGYDKYKDVLCYVDDIDVTRGYVALFNKGAPLLRVYNRFISMYSEAGLLERYWSLLKSRQLLNSNTNISSEYFVFEMEHVLPIFMFLFISWCVCSLIYLIKLCFKFIFNFVRKRIEK